MVSRDAVDVYQVLDLFLVSDGTKDLDSKISDSVCYEGGVL